MNNKKIKKYLSQTNKITLTKFKKIFNIYYKKKNDKNIDRLSYPCLDVVGGNHSKLSFRCNVCQMIFKNQSSHNFIMFTKCPNIDKEKEINYMETISNKYYNYKVLINANLDEKIIFTDEQQNSYFITSTLIIKCPICLCFKPNCIIQKCGHCLCRECLKGYLVSCNNNNNNYNNERNCWMCRQKSEDYIFKL